ncbi:hypothetical protein DFP73DRAFT_563271 [Morchella snyderi]|nr:hypothetical protein DFP73DRAFT_563271 [Morchella snyderi]
MGANCFTVFLYWVLPLMLVFPGGGAGVACFCFCFCFFVFLLFVLYLFWLLSISFWRRLQLKLLHSFPRDLARELVHVLLLFSFSSLFSLLFFFFIAQFQLQSSQPRHVSQSVGRWLYRIIPLTLLLHTLPYHTIPHHTTLNIYRNTTR